MTCPAGTRLFKRDSKGKIRVWSMEIDSSQPERYRTVSGTQDGKMTESAWKTAKPKNVGRSNATSATQQAILEVTAKYEKQLAQGRYSETLEGVDDAKYFAPMLAEKYEDYPPTEYPVFVQPKLDGMRCIATKDGLFTRKGKQWLSVPHVWEYLQRHFEYNPYLVLDGELYNHDYKDRFSALASVLRKQKPSASDLAESEEIAEYHVYDCHLGDDAPFSHRMRMLSLVFEVGGPDCVKLVETNTCESLDETNDLHAASLAEGYEGSIVRLDTPYANKRTKALLKRKEFIDEEFEIIRIEEGIGNLAGMAGSVLCRAKNGRVFGAGIKGGRSVNKEYWRAREGLVGCLATVCYFELTEYGVPRFGVVKDVNRNE